MDAREPVDWAPGMWVLADTSPAAWIETTLTPAPSSWTVADLVPAVFPGYARVLPPTYDPADPSLRHRWPQIAAATGVPLTAETRFDDLVAGADRWGRPSDGGLDARETAALARVLGEFTGTPAEAYFCLWEGFGLPETEAWADRPMRVEVPYRAHHLLSGPVAVAPVLPTPVEWRCASLWWPADRAWLVATDIDGYLTYVGGGQAAIDAVLTAPDLDAVAVQPTTPLDPSYG